MLHITHTIIYCWWLYLAKNPISQFDADHKKIGSGFVEDTVGGQASGHGWGRLRELGEGRQMVKKLLCKRAFDAAIETASKSKFKSKISSLFWGSEEYQLPRSDLRIQESKEMTLRIFDS